MRVLFIFTILFSSFFSNSQEIKLNQHMLVDSTLKSSADSNEIFINFSDKEKQLIYNSLQRHIVSNKNLYYGSVFNKSNFVENRAVDSTEFYLPKLVKTNDSLFKNDSIRLFYQLEKKDKNGVQIYDNEGDPIYYVDYFYHTFSDCLYKLLTNEKWSYKNEKVSKEIFHNGISTKLIIDNYGQTDIDHYYTYDTLKQPSVLFKKDVVYTHYFYPEYYKAFLNSTLMDEIPYSDKVKKGFKASAIINEFEVNKFLEPILKDIQENKLKLFGIENDSIIVSEKIKPNDIAGLFYSTEYPKIDENGEQLYDDYGYPSFITTRTVIRPQDILGIEFHEDWFIGTNSFQLKKVVKGIMLIRGVFNDDGILSGMFKVPAYISFE